MGKRYLCWDERLMSESSGVSVVMHHPEKKNIALLCDDEWEGVHNGYACVMKIDGGYRMYYRADSSRHLIADKACRGGKPCICVAESKDGINFTKPILKKHEYNGTKYNNIVFMRNRFIDNFAVFYDKNPNCPADEKYKALSEMSIEDKPRLVYYASADGYDFTQKYIFDIEGYFDSYNTIVWDENTEQYFLYYRNFHDPGDNDPFAQKTVGFLQAIRDIRVAVSKDFKTWTPKGRIMFKENTPEFQLYTNQVIKYYRDDDTFIGFPARYFDRAEQKRNFDHMPLCDRHKNITEVFGREGTAVTDCSIMTSSDGINFDLRTEAFLTPGAEAQNNWWYGNCYTAYGMVQTPSDERGASDEISIYVGENYRIKSVNFRRYTVRLDGFFSWYGKYSGGEVLTEPIKVEGNALYANFATSAMGGMQITLCDENKNEIEGYSSYVMFGDSTNRPVEFSKPLLELSGQAVRLKIKLSDAHLYSFVFVKE